MFIIRHIVFFILQFTVFSAAVTGICAGVTLHTYGWQYRLTPEFAEKLHTYINLGLVAGALFCLILFCYHLTRKSLEVSGDEPWNNTDNLG
ncbi:MAG TPA: hypothetical protein VLZ84_05275 [Asticcacaulis sp.]|nr:hypothetical protein [Asticcacaulis sp.]